MEWGGQPTEIIREFDHVFDLDTRPLAEKKLNDYKELENVLDNRARFVRS